MTALIERFMDKVSPEPNSGCWLWDGAQCSDGYGSLGFEGKTRRAHKWFYENLVGPVPKGLVLDHKCRVRCCVNPEHLRVVTNRENTLCGIGQPAMRAKQTVCKHGHPLSGENLYVNPKGYRNCRICKAALAVAWVALRKKRK